jgi:hypothetical protein
VEFKEAKIFKGIISLEEINTLKDYYSQKPVTQTRFKDDAKTILKAKLKDSDYNIVDSIVYKILGPKIKNIVGDHAMTHGAHFESFYPYGIHTDTDTTNAFAPKLEQHINLNLGVLIPLTESDADKTIFFKHFTDHFSESTKLPDKIVKHDDLSIFDHLNQWHKDRLQFLEIDKIFEWKLGDMAMWDRNQIHCAGNFLSHGTSKKHIALLI